MSDNFVHVVTIVVKSHAFKFELCFVLEKFSANSLTFTESDEDSEEETTVFDKNRLVNGHARLNGSANGKLKYRDHAM